MAEIDQPEIDLLELFSLFYRKKIKIIFYTFLGAALGFGMARISVPLYKADSLIQLEEKSNGGMALSTDLSGLFGNAPQTASEIEILRSRMILRQVIEALKLDISASPKRLPIIGYALTRYDIPQPDFEFLTPYAWHDQAITVSAMGMPASLEDKTLTLTYLGDNSFTVAFPNGQEIEGTVGTPLRVPELGFFLQVDSLVGEIGNEFTLRKTNMASTLAALRGKLSIGEQGKKSLILQISITDPDPARATAILAKMNDIYLLQNLNRNAAEAAKSLAFIEDQLPEAEANMRTAAAAVNEYQLSQDSIDLNFETRSLLEKSVAIEAQLNDLALQEQELQKRFTPAHPAYQTLLDSRAQLESQLAEIRSQSENLPQAQLEMLRLTQNLEVARQIYLQLVSRSQELSVIKAGTIGNIRVIDAPMAFPKPVKPSAKTYTAIAAILALIFAITSIAIKFFLNKTVDSQDTLETLGLSVFGTVQKVGNGEYAGPLKRAKNPKILAKVEPTNLAVEALRSLRTSLHFGMLDAKSNIVLMTSSRPGEGKSFVSVNLATVIAESGQSTCLIDIDLRRGYLRRYFGVGKPEPGLSDVLAETATLDEVIKQDPDTGLHFIATGKYPPNPSELFMHPGFSRLCDDLNERFDIVIMDAPPLLAVTDPVIIGKFAGMILMVVRHKLTVEGEVSAALRILENNNLKAAGAVLNGYDPKASKNGGNDYSYQYDYKTRN
jgi:tyrosine-protein kinase Etk/Wzc